MPNVTLGRYCDLKNIKEESNLEKGMDFRLPQYRREVFLRFYEFHLKYKTHPGLVYLIFPKMAEIFNWSQEQKYWFAFINGCTQNPCTTWAIFSEFPELDKIDINDFEKWHKENWKFLDYDIDRRYQKGHLVSMVSDYIKHLEGKTQHEFFECVLKNEDPKLHFKNVWNKVYNEFYMYGRLSSFSYIEYLKIMGLGIEFNSFFMDDLKGSKSHRNGILKVCGRDDLDWFDKNETWLSYNMESHTSDIVNWANEQAWLLLEEAKERFKDKEFYNDVGAQTLESTLCCYKSWHRENRRYPNVYTDMHYDRVKKAEKLWGNKKDFSVFWNIRKDNLPKYLLREFNPDDPGLKPIKQNWYRNTGQVIMMDKEWECFKNDFNDKYYGENKVIYRGLF